MKHQWETLPSNVSKVGNFGWEPVRICKVCGRAQRHEIIHEWMVVECRRWLPLVGRCPGELQPNKLGWRILEWKYKHGME